MNGMWFGIDKTGSPWMVSSRMHCTTYYTFYWGFLGRGVMVLLLFKGKAIGSAFVSAKVVVKKVSFGSLK